ncbi:uncharacterized protein [Salminus brasiliensis]|uniref:uncharacterized protein isoform X2 n=1 Tax=Salminus brasiliensis TaxID=930266 RepID=UPI003B82F404
MARQDTAALQPRASSRSVGHRNGNRSFFISEDFLITQLIQKIEALQLSKGVSAAKKASSSRSSIVHSAHEPAICFVSPESAKVLRHRHDNQLRMLTHRWKTLGLQHLASGNRDDHAVEHSQEKTDCPLKITAIQTSHDRAPRDRKQEGLSSNISGVGIPEVKVNHMDAPSNTAVSIQFNSDDSDLSDQEKEKVHVSKWSAPVELDLRPEPFHCDPGPSHSTEIEDRQVYPEVLPAPLKDLDFTHGLSSTETSETQQRLFASDPCLAPMVARLLELEKLQSATVQKERAKPVRSRPTTAGVQTRNTTRLRNGEFPASKLESSVDAECNSVTCSLTKLTLCSNSSCRCRHDTCPLIKLGHGSRGACLHQTLLKRPHTMSGKFNRTATLVPAFSVNVKASPKPKTPNRTKRLRTTKKSTPRPQREDSTSAKKTMAAPSRRT